MILKWSKHFILIAGGLLVAAALVRFLILFRPAQSLALPDPLLGIPLRPAVFLAGLLELAAGLICLFGKNSRLQAMVLAWLATNWVVYRIGLMWLGIHPQGTFLGMLTDPLKLAGTPAGFAVSWLPFVFVGICYTAAIDAWLGSRRGEFRQGVLSRLRRSYQVRPPKPRPENFLPTVRKKRHPASTGGKAQNVLFLLSGTHRISTARHRGKNSLPPLQNGHHAERAGMMA